MIWKYGKLRFSTNETVTAAGVLVLTADSAQFQVFTGTSTHTMRLPNATTTSNGSGIMFTVINESTGEITIQLSDGVTTLATVPAGASMDVLLTAHGSANGTWSVGTYAGGSGGGGGSVDPGSTITSSYAVLAGDNGRVLNVDSSVGAITVTLPAPSAAFVVSIKDVGSYADVNAITIARNGSELIDGVAMSTSINRPKEAKTFVSDGTNWFVVGTFALPVSEAGRGIFGGGDTTGSTTVANVIDYFAFESLASAVDFGDLATSRGYTGACSSHVKGIWAGGTTGSVSNNMDYVTIATLANAIDFGDLTVSRSILGGCSNSTRGLFGGGSTGATSNVIDYITIASEVSAIDFGDLTDPRDDIAALASQTRGIWGGGNSGGVSNIMDYITIATLANALDFGDLTVSRKGMSGCANRTRGLFGGGFNGVATFYDIIEHITIATTGNGTDFGDLASSRYDPGSTASPLLAVWAGGFNGSVLGTMNVVNIATLGNATAFGSLSVSREGPSACSNVHGGI